MQIEVKMNKEIMEYREAMFFGLDFRQMACSLLAVLAAVGIYFSLRGVTGEEVTGWLCMLGAAPFAFCGFFRYHGMTAEQFAWAFIKSEFLYPKRLLFQPEDLYYQCLEERISYGESGKGKRKAEKMRRKELKKNRKKAIARKRMKRKLIHKKQAAHRRMGSERVDGQTGRKQENPEQTSRRKENQVQATRQQEPRRRISGKQENQERASRPQTHCRQPGKSQAEQNLGIGMRNDRERRGQKRPAGSQVGRKPIYPDRMGRKPGSGNKAQHRNRKSSNERRDASD